MAEAVALEWVGGSLILLDQRVLPSEECYLRVLSSGGVVEAIRSMVVRGAPAIGIAAAYGSVLAAKESIPDDIDLSQPIVSSLFDTWLKHFNKKLVHLATSRPTAVNLFWALDKVKMFVSSSKDTMGNWNQWLDAILGVAISIHQQDIEDNKAMAVYGAAIIEAANEGGRLSVLTHCNAGAIATGGYGTALGVVRRLWEKGMLESVYADETRPWLQGARLTAWELQKEGITTILNVDAAAAHVMRKNKVKWVIVGADRITANGDVANKIGTYGLAILARYHGVKFMVVAPSSTIDMTLSSGDQIQIEERSGKELTDWNKMRVAAEGISVFNPVFDVTPANLIDVIVTEKGTVSRPDTVKMNRLMEQ